MISVACFATTGSLDFRSTGSLDFRSWRQNFSGYGAIDFRITETPGREKKRCRCRLQGRYAEPGSSGI